MRQPGGRAPAPGRLERVQAFVNTSDIENERDSIATPEALRRWFVARGLLERRAPASSRDHQDALEVREALRALMEANNAGKPAPAAAAILTRTLARCQPELRFAAHGGSRADVRILSGGARHALGNLLVAVHDAMRDGSWSRMKACADGRCRWAFYDHSRNASGRWCSMSVCGTRAKVEAAAARSGSRRQIRRLGTRGT